jgi:hypothetical protein
MKPIGRNDKGGKAPKPKSVFGTNQMRQLKKGIDPVLATVGIRNIPDGKDAGHNNASTPGDAIKQ